MTHKLKLAAFPEASTQTQIIEAQDKLILQCGKSQIELHSNGKIILKGLELIQSGKKNIKLHSEKIELN